MLSRSSRSVPARNHFAVTTVYRVMKGDYSDFLLPARSQDSLDVPVVTSTLSLGMPLRHGGNFQGRFSEDPVVRYRQQVMHAIAFGSNYDSLFLHCTKSLAVAVKKLGMARPGAYLVKIDLHGLSGSQPVLQRGSAGQRGVSGFQPATPNPVVIDMSSDRHQKVGEQQS